MKIFEGKTKIERAFVECVVVRLEDVKKLLELIYSNIELFHEIDPDITDLFDRIESRGSINILLDDAFGKTRRDSEFELMDNHFGQISANLSNSNEPT